MERESQEVQLGVEKTSASGTALLEIIKMSEDVGDMITTIATAATEQSAASEEIDSNVSKISNSIQQSSSSAEQTSQACADLSTLAVNLQHVVNQFKVNSGDETSGNSPREAQGQTKMRESASPKAAAASSGR
jgi:methyl-accepting chemotaxis protein